MRLLFDLYRLSGLAFSYRRYIAVLMGAPAAVGLAVGAAASLLISSPAGLILGAAAALITFAVILGYPVHLVSSRRTHFENNFPYTLSVLLPLLTAGVPLGRAVARLAEVEDDKYIARELSLAVRDIVVMGSSPLEALLHSAERVPSASYRETVDILVRSSRVTERLDLVLMARLDWMLRQKQIRAASLARSISLLFEIYAVAAMLLPILVFTMALALSPLGVLQVAGLSLDPLSVMILAGLIYSPIAGAMFYILFDASATI
ncbi:type II secretion system F family protein [Thermoproteus tenax]|uniref:Type II/IV secretion system membrane component, FlaJ/TadC family n=1 Tax=Thermoproteus tenax (strain ATCC 35583 / DSM 2078 / JCM 9277 / NBRC 100435 / Kra 1) TaxID=768679 RepID=G4RJN0_THETK|nr:type II secretion system F family protein [Thermoproteus tenax]CCC81775.1 Type II/IV secretion system membrane component, FlaJ/TadC family [Thermoproteus tenax Kra 1]